jgi:hypothetical protein
VSKSFTTDPNELLEPLHNHILILEPIDYDGRFQPPALVVN